MSVIGPGGMSVHPGTIRDKAAAALIEMPSHLRQIGISLQQLATQGELHIYSVDPARSLEDGTQVWGVYCYACSETAKEYVYPCVKKADQVGTDAHPPRILLPAEPPAEPVVEDQTEG